MTGELVCRTSPEVNATVYYNGTKLTNPTPVRLIKLSPGVKTIKYELAGYESSTDRVEVFDDTTSYSTVTLKSTAPPIEEKGKIRCVTTPPGADVYFNGRKQVNKTPVTLTGVTPNKFHTIKFTKSNFLDASDQWLVKPGQTIVAEKILIPVMQPGYINAISDLPGVTVKMIIEGKTYSYPAPHKFGAPAGRNVVFFSKPGHKQVEHSITVEPRQTVTLKGNPIPIVAETILTLNTLPKSITEGDKVTLSGTLKTKDAKPLFGTIKFYDSDPAPLKDDPLVVNDKPLITTSDRTTGKFLATWTAISMDKPLKQVNIIAKFDATSTHNKSISPIRTIQIKDEIVVPETGGVIVRTDPPGATIYIDNKKQDKTTEPDKLHAVFLDLSVGKHTIKTVVSEFDPIEEEITIIGGKNINVRHSHEAPKNMCQMFGIDVSGLGCIRAILTIPVDLWTPLADAHVIKYHRSMYTGKPEDPTKWTYAAFALGCVPLVGGPAKTVGKTGFELFSRGIDFIKIARTNPELLRVLDTNLFFTRLPSMTDSDIVKALDFAKTGKLDELEEFIQTFKITAIPDSMMKTWTDNMLKVIDADDIAELKSILKIGVPAVEFAKKYKDLFKEFLAGTRLLTDADIIDFLKHIESNPDDFWALMKIVPRSEYDAVAKKITVLGLLDPVGIDYFLRESSRVIDMLAKVPEIHPRTQKVWRAAMDPHAKKEVADLAKLTLKDLDLPGKITITDAESMKAFMDYTHDALYFVDFDSATEFSSKMLADLIASRTKTKTPIIMSSAKTMTAEMLDKTIIKPEPITTVIKHTPKPELDEVITKMDLSKHTEVLGDMLAWAKPFDDLPELSLAPITKNSADIASSIVKFSDDVIPEASDMIANYMDTIAAIRKMEWISPTGKTTKVIDDVPSLTPTKTTDSLASAVKDTVPNFDDLKSTLDNELLSLTKFADDFVEKLPDGSSLKFPVDPDEAARAKTVFKALVPVTEFSKKYLKLFDEIIAGKLDNVTDDTINEFINAMINKPLEVIPIIYDTPKIRSTIYHLFKSTNPNVTPKMIVFRKALYMSYRLSEFLKATPEAFALRITKNGEIAKAILANTPDEIKAAADAIDEIGKVSETVDPLLDAIKAAGLKIPFNLINEIEIFLDTIKSTPILSRPKATVTFVKSILNGMYRFMKNNPKFAMATTITGMTMVAWALYEISSFFGAYLIPKYLGLGPGDRTFRANEFSDTLTGMFFTCDAACKTGNLDSLKTCTDNFSLTLTNFEDYVEEHREALEREQTLDVAEGNILLHHMNLDRLLECLPPEIIIPESGLIENVFVKKIIDGDTVECSTEKFPSFRVRTAGINTPEKKPMGLDFYPVSCTTTSGAEPHTIECTKDMWYAANGQFWKLIDDKTVTLKIRSDRPKDDYGRYIAAIIASDETEINIEMLKSGNACYYHRADFGPTEGDIIDHDAYIAARDEAKAAGLGIWASEELESDIGSAIFKAFRLTEEDKPIGLTAEIWLGDDFLYNSSTTKERDWSVGSHEVIFKAMGYIDNPVKFTIEKNKPIIVDATLIPTKAIVDEGYAILRTYRISTTGSLVAITSDIYEDDIYLFRTSASTLRAFSPGEHTVVFKNINYEDKPSTFTIGTDKTITVNGTLVELPEDETEDPAEPDEPFGLVDFMSTPSVAKIFVNGGYIGTTKKSGFKLTEGPYSIMFEKEGYEPCTKPLTVVADERFPVECVLMESLLPPVDPSYPDLPYFPSTPSRRRLPPSTYEITPIPTLPPAAPEPEAEPWEEFKAPMKVLFLNIGKEVTKQTSIATAGQKFMDKHCDLDFEWESEDHDMVELGMDDNDCATLDDTEELTETIERDTIPDNTKIIYLLWNADEPKCVSYTGFTGDIEDLLFDAMLCSSPTSKSKPEFTATTGKLKNDNLEIKYEGSLTIIIQICEALHELYEKTKSDDAPELPEFDEEFCKKNITEDRPNAKCVVEWLSKFNDALPKEL